MNALIGRNASRGTIPEDGDQAILIVRFDIPRPILLQLQQNRHSSQSSGQTFQFFMEENENHWILNVQVNMFTAEHFSVRI